MRLTPSYSDPRRPPRFDLRAPVAYEAQPGEGRGLIWNISLSGARLEATSTQLPTGCTITLRAAYYDGSAEVEIPGRVVRHTDKGFAVQFEDLPLEAQRLLQTILP